MMREVLERAYRKAGLFNDADSQLRWLAENRGRAYAEYNSSNYLQAANVFVHYQATEKLKNKGS
jgi:hypothetical protein